MATLKLEFADMQDIVKLSTKVATMYEEMAANKQLAEARQGLGEEKKRSVRLRMENSELKLTNLELERQKAALEDEHSKLKNEKARLCRHIDEMEPEYCVGKLSAQDFSCMRWRCSRGR